MAIALVIALVLVASVVLVAAVAVLAGRRRGGAADDPAAAKLLRAHQAPVTVDAVAFVDGYLARRSSLRWACALLAIVAVNIVGFVVRDEPTLTIDLFPIMVAYAVGTLVAELRLTRSRGPVAQASLTARTVDRYLGSDWLLVQRVAIAAAVLLAGAVVLAVPGGDVSRVESGLYALAALVVGVGAEWSQRRIVGRAQPSTAPDLIAADDAVRSSSVHAIAGVAIADLVMTSGVAVAQLTGNVWPAVVGVPMGLFLWYRCAQPVGTARRVLLVAASLVVVVGLATTLSVLALRSATVTDTDTDTGPRAPVTAVAEDPADTPTTVAPATIDPTTTTGP